MLTANGLRLASGVRKCKILGFSISASLPRSVLRRHQPMLTRRAWSAASTGAKPTNLATAIATGADTEGQRGVRAEAPHKLAPERLRLAVILDKDEAGRAPRTLPDARKPCAAQPFENGGAAPAGRTSALHGGEVVAEPRADLADALRDGGEVLLGQTRQHAQQGKPAELP